MPVWTLDGGVKMPTLALNTAGLTTEGTARALRLAIDSGITHVDFHPGIERDGVAKVLRSGAKRSSLFLTTKIRKAAPGTAPEAAAAAVRAQIAQDLDALGVERVDLLMLRDSPDCAAMRAQWAVLEDARRAGKTRAIGVVNFCQSALECLLDGAGNGAAAVKPAVNYFMLHAGMGPDAHGLRTFGESRGVRTFAYGALGEPGPSAELLSSPAVRQAAAAHGGKSPEEVAMRWVLQSGAALSVRPSRNFGLAGSLCEAGVSCRTSISSRAKIFDWELTEMEMAALDALKSPDGNPTLFSSSGCPGAFVFPM